MKLVRWSFHNIHMPMMEDNEGTLYCTSKQLCDALRINEQTLRWIYSSRKEEFLDPNCVGGANAIQFFKDHREAFGIRYVRKDMRLWSDNDMLLIAMTSRSEHSKEFRRELINLVKRNARKEYITKEEYEELIKRNEDLAKENCSIKHRLGAIEEALEWARPALRQQASAAGLALQAQRRVSPLRQFN